MEGVNILIVEDDILVSKGFQAVLRKEGYHVVTVESGEEALKEIKKDRFRLVLTDLMLGGIDGLKVLEKTKEISPSTLVIVITGYESMDTIIKALKEGAYDYLIKPCKDIDLKMTVKRGLEKWGLEQELIKAERLMAVMQTAVTTNHEVNSPLQVMLMRAELLLVRKENLDSDSFDRVQTVLNETLKIRDIIKKLTKIAEQL